MSDRILRAEGIGKSYGSGDTGIVVLRGLDLEIEAGEALAVVGDSGVGKSTLLHVLGGLDRPDEGSLLFDGRSVFDTDLPALARYRNSHIGFVFQFHHLLPEFTAVENVEMPFRIGRIPGRHRDRAREILERLGLAGRLHHYPSALSGGEQQRVAIARAVVGSPSVVLADEPTGNLDPGTGAAVFETLRQLQSQEGFSLVLATHSARLARGCDRILRLVEGGLRPLGEVETKEYFEA